MKRPPALDDFLTSRPGNGPALSGEDAMRAECEAFRAAETPAECCEKAPTAESGRSPFDDDEEEDFFGCAPNFKVSGTLTFKD